MNSIPQSTTASQYDKPQPNVAGDLPVRSTTLGNDANISAACKNRVRKYRALGYARHLLIKYNVRNRNGTNPHRTRFCHAVKARNEKHITLKLNTNDINSDAAIGGVQTCGSIWSCPVCASRKAVEKGRFVQNAIAWAGDNGLIPVMVSLTARHHARMPLKAFKTAFKAAWGDFTNRRSWKAFKRNFGAVHWVANREVTHGENGWHYHMHWLVFVDKRVLAVTTGEALQQKLTPDWLHCLERQGMDGLPEFALRVSAHGNVGEKYLIKIGLTVESKDDDLHYELTGGMNKKGSRTVWDILRHAYYGDGNSERLYIEYVEAMQGDNFITTSHGLTECVENWLDEQAEPEPEAPTLHAWVTISDEIWAYVVAANAFDKVIDCAARYRSIPKLRELLTSLRDELMADGKHIERRKSDDN